MKIDAHQHFWHFDPVRDAWITDEMQAIRRDFLPSDLKLVLEQNQMDGCVAVQAAQEIAETDFLLQLANENDFIKGVVGWTDLQAPNLAERLAEYQKAPRLRGFRHVLQAEPDEAFMLRPAFIAGVRALRDYGFTYDILIYPQHLPNALRLVQQCADQPFVLDHLAKPYIREGLLEPWKKDLTALADQENVCCKISGIITEADWSTWTYEQLVPYLDVAFEAFGTDRLLFGSDWPVCLVAGDYQRVKQVLERYLENFTSTEKENIWGGNAARFYNLN
ncbi:amidohydrolase family protein [Salmonirosea aquatica]|uniref:Amidohydrolase family protein n=1 Tax=Salmonirosea aquatica TaxID=2654236 RepID=A0A7C9BJW6_9BACT|nr:amidohydrolase family protein [Cytophagaceae bacterium SJW1-29]